VIDKKVAFTIIMIGLGFILAAATTGVMGSPKDNTGVNVVNLAVYEDSKCQTSCTSINWGTVTANSYISKTLYVRNPNTCKLTLAVTVSNWTPQESQSLLSVSCNRNNFVLQGGKIVPVTLTLAIGPNVGTLKDFGCIITFSGTK